MNRRPYGSSLLALSAFAAMGALAPEPRKPKIDPKNPPKRMDINETPREICLAWRVLFNGQEQRACIIADREKGYILRYKFAIGSMPVKNRFGKYETEELHGEVEFKPKAEESV